MTYKFNSSNGAIICDECGIILKEGLSYKEYLDIHQQDACKNYNKQCNKEKE